MNATACVWTIGHGTRALDELLGRLAAYGIRRLVDVRTVPRSRRNPQFNRETLPAALAGSGLAYTHLPGLGGLRRPRSDSANTGWRNAGFRGYADYMQTPEFEASLEALVALAAAEPVAVMCAETLPWRCHRSLLADALVVRGWSSSTSWASVGQNATRCGHGPAWMGRGSRIQSRTIGCIKAVSRLA